MNKFSFKNKEECKKSIKLVNHNKYNTFKTIIKFAADNDDIKKIIKLRKQKTKNNKKFKKCKLNITEIDNYTNNLTKLKFYKFKDEYAFTNTLLYLFYKIGSGIYIKIEDNKINMFYPFSNIHYKNNVQFKFNKAESFKDYVKRKRPDAYNYDLKTWSMNGCLINNWKKSQINDSRWAENYDIFRTLCKHKKIPNCEFFINYKDFPVINKKLYEPNFFIHDKMNQKMNDHKYNSYLPIFSCYSSPKYADFMLPSYTEWKMITKKFYPDNSRFNCENNRINIKEIPWKNKKATAQFRGGATGCGITRHTNQRLHIAKLSQQWKTDSRYNENNTIDKIPFLNAGITSYNVRDKKDYKNPVDVINIQKLNIQKSDYLSRDDQQYYKYVVYIDGHVAAERLIFELNSGSVILKVESLYNWMQWFHLLLKPNIHYIPVKKDLSDLAEKIKWCKTHDKECYKITQNAKKLFKEINNKEYILNYLQSILSNFQ